VTALIATVTGWLAAALMAVALLAALSPRVMIARRLVGSARMMRSGHYRLGGAAALAGAAHCLLSVTRAPLPVLQEVGNWASAGAAAVLAMAAFAGLTLREAAPGETRHAKTYHLLAISLAAALGTVHVLLNGS
jgi:hypothetical protein